MTNFQNFFYNNMNLRIIVSITAIVAAALIPARAVISISPSDAERALTVLDDSLSLSDHFIGRRQAELNQLCDSLRKSDTSAHGRLMLHIIDRYTAFNNDSAMRYLDLGLESPEITDKLPFLLRRAVLLPLSGFAEAAERIYDSIPEESVPDSLKALYYDSGRQMYSYMAAFAASQPRYHKLYTDKALERQQRLLDILPNNSIEYKFNLGEYYFLTGENGKARALLSEITERLPVESNLRARAAHHLSTIAHGAKDDNAYVYYLAQSALADVCAATREVASLQELGNHLYTLGDVNRAYTYLTTALANAVECGAPLRMIESSESLPIIEHAKTEQINAKQRTVLIALGFAFLVVVALIVSMFVLRREMRRMNILQNNLRHSNRVKEIYISQFLNLCSIYMDKLNQLSNIVNRKIATGKIDDLYRLTKSGKFVEEQSREFYNVFDNAFIHLYPNFVKQVNALLRPDQQIELKDDEVLNTDLRILAFMRLGIEESARIAQVLNYSLNTIYAYRNRTKARAINRDTFEADIMKISSES